MALSTQKEMSNVRVLHVHSQQTEVFMSGIVV